MTPTPLPDVSFREGTLIERLVPCVFGGSTKLAKIYWIIGDVLGAGPFLLTYQEPSVAHWSSPVQLGESLRKKILGKLRKDVRHAANLPSWMTQHDLSQMETKASEEAAFALWQVFHRDRWRDRVLDDRDADWIILSVPFKDKDLAKNAGARWNAQAKSWEAHKDKLDDLKQWAPVIDNPYDPLKTRP